MTSTFSAPQHHTHLWNWNSHVFKIVAEHLREKLGLLKEITAMFHAQEPVKSFLEN